MKKAFLVMITILSTFALGFTACSDDDDPVVNELTVSSNYLALKTPVNNMDESVRTIAITGGNGEYEIIPSQTGSILAEAWINKDEVNFIAKTTQGLGKFTLKDKLGKETEIVVKVDAPYILLEINGSKPYVKAKTTAAENVLKEELAKETTVQSPKVIEMTVSVLDQKYVNIYKNMTDAANGEIETSYPFDLSTEAPELILGQSGKEQQVYQLWGSIFTIYYRYFGIPMDFDLSEQRSERSAPPVSQDMFYDQTSKYKEKYPDFEIEYAGIVVNATPYLYKVMPVAE